MSLLSTAPFTGKSLDVAGVACYTKGMTTTDITVDEFGNTTFYKSALLDVYTLEHSPYVTVSGDLRGYFPDSEDDGNYVPRNILRVICNDANLNIIFDPEFSCFFAYAKTIQDAMTLVGMIESLVLKNRA